MFKKFIGERYSCGLDVGGQSIKACVIQSSDESQSQLLGVYEEKTHGFKDGSISDLADLSECIHMTLAELIKKTGVKLKEVQLGLGGDLLETRQSAAVIPLIDRGSKVIANRDVKKVQMQARLLGVKMEEIVLHDFPQYYKVDDINTAINPVGLYGRKLEIKTVLVVANNTLTKNLTKAVNQAGYDVNNIFYTSLSSSEACLTEYQKRQGCVLVDMGSAVTDILIFKEGFLKHLVSIPLGGEHVTRNISNQLKLSLDLAESLKISYASVMSSDAKLDEEILIKREEGYLPIKKEKISHSIEPIVIQLVEAIGNAIRISGLYDQMNVGIIMVGGGALLPGLPERIENDMNLPVKMGKIHMVTRKLPNVAKYIAAVGLAQLGMKKAYSFTSSPQGHSNAASFIANKVKELYQEYF